MKYRISGSLDIRRCVNDCRGIARAYADCRLTAAVRCLDHAGTARSQNDVSLFHYHCAERNAWLVYPTDDALGRARLNCSVKHNFSSLDGALFGSWVWRNDKSVACLECKQRLEYCRRSRVGGRHDSRNHAHRLYHFGDTEALVSLYHTARHGVFVGVVDIFGSVVVFDNLVFHDTHARLLDSHFGKWNSRFVSSHSRFEEDFVYLLLCKRCKLRLRLTKLLESCQQRLLVIYIRNCHFYIS